MWVARGRPNAVITILDNRSYALTSPLTLADDSFLVIQAGDGRRPHILPDGGELQITGDHPGSELTLSGLLVEGAMHVTGETQTPAPAAHHPGSRTLSGRGRRPRYHIAQRYRGGR